jgi:hypothetical protein
LPIAIASRPQLASAPAIAVLTSGEFAMLKAIVRADSSVTAPATRTSISFCAPSPSRTTCLARSVITSASAPRKRSSSGSSTRAGAG